MYRAFTTGFEQKRPKKKSVRACEEREEEEEDENRKKGGYGGRVGMMGRRRCGVGDYHSVMQCWVFKDRGVVRCEADHQEENSVIQEGESSKRGTTLYALALYHPSSHDSSVMLLHAKKSTTNEQVSSTVAIKDPSTTELDARQRTPDSKKKAN